jgi:hypothetical protein
MIHIGGGTSIKPSPLTLYSDAVTSVRNEVRMIHIGGGTSIKPSPLTLYSDAVTTVRN